MTLSNMSRILAWMVTLMLVCGVQGMAAGPAAKPLGKVKELRAEIQEGGVLLSWQVVAGSDGYRLYHDTGPEVREGAFWVDVNGRQNTSSLFTEVVKGEAYSFQVAAMRGAEVGAPSAVVRVQIPGGSGGLRSDVGE